MKLPPALTLALKLAITAAGVAFLAATTDVAEVTAAIAGAAPLTAVLCVIALTAALYFSAWRWQVLLRVDGVDVGRTELLLVYLESGFFGLFLPSAIGGDVFRGWRIHGRVGGARRTAVNLLVERVVGLSSLGAVGLIALAMAAPVEPEASAALLIASLLVIATTAIVLSPAGWIAVRLAERLRLGRVAALLARIAEQVAGYRRFRITLPAVFALSLLQQLAAAGSILLAAASVDLWLDVSVYVAAVPAAGLLALVPSIGGIGPREVGLAYMLGAAGASEGAAVAAAALFLGAMIARSLLGGLIYLIRRPPAGPVETADENG